MNPNGYTIRLMDRADLDVAVSWAAKEGWNPGRADAECFYAADPSGFFMGYLGEEPVASISAVKYGKSFGFVGFYIVKEEHRGKGFGWRIWQRAMESLAGRIVGLDGVVAQQDNYRKTGFSLGYNNIRFEGVGGGLPSEDRDIVSLQSLPFDAVAAYDAPFFPDDRKRFLQRWITQPGSVALGLCEHGTLRGYGVARPCVNGWKIGPLFADEPKGADKLMHALRARTPHGAPIFLDVPEVNEAALDLARRLKMTKTFETARMYRGRPPEIPLDRLYGVTTFELG